MRYIDLRRNGKACKAQITVGMNPAWRINSGVNSIRKTTQSSPEIGPSIMT